MAFFHRYSCRLCLINDRILLNWFYGIFSSCPCQPCSSNLVVLYDRLKVAAEVLDSTGQGIVVTGSNRDN